MDFTDMKTMAEVKITDMEAVHIKVLLSWGKTQIKEQDCDKVIYDKIENYENNRISFTQLELQRVISQIHKLSILLYIVDEAGLQEKRQPVLKSCNQFADKCQEALQDITFMYDPYKWNIGGAVFELTLMEIDRIFDMFQIVEVYCEPDNYAKVKSLEVDLANALYAKTEVALSADTGKNITTVLTVYGNLMNTFSLKEVMPESVERDRELMKKICRYKY